MGKRNDNHVRKESFLRKVLELKGQLFGAFSLTVTKDSKRQAWMELRDYAVAIGLVTADKDHTYVRDATWPNMRSRTVAKVDNAYQTGSGGGSSKKLDVIDHLVLDIIGRESPVLQGFGTEDSLGEIVLPTMGPTSASTSDYIVALEESRPISATEIDGSWQNGELQHQQETPKARGTVKKRVLVQHPEETKEIESLKKRKLQLEVRKLELEVWEKENLLNIEHSPHTSGVQERGKKELSVPNEYLIVENNDGNFVVVQPQM
ncbi:uncharacterized protein [Anabrus simplex]|uniref:uncharacterized protein n=1 Tax=Anabrus simplex TaxID=316456 RepID=UPI0035A3246F